MTNPPIIDCVRPVFVSRPIASTRDNPRIYSERFLLAVWPVANGPDAAYSFDMRPNQPMNLLFRTLVLGAGVLAAGMTQAQQWFFRIGPSFGQPVLGSEDTRRGTYYGVGFAKPEGRLKYRGSTPNLLVETYYLFTKGGGFEDIPVNDMRSYGLSVTARYRIGRLGKGDIGLDLGWGAVYNSIRTRDLDSNLNSTPMIGVSLDFQKYDMSVRWYHASNGGSSGNNQGTNQIQYLVGFKF